MTDKADDHLEDYKGRSEVAFLGGRVVLVIEPADAVLIRSALHRQAQVTKWAENRAPLERVRDEIGFALGSSVADLEAWNRIDTSMEENRK